MFCLNILKNNKVGGTIWVKLYDSIITLFYHNTKLLYLDFIFLKMRTINTYLRLEICVV